MKLDDHQCATAVLNELYKNQLAIADALGSLSYWLLENGEGPVAWTLACTMKDIAKSSTVIQVGLRQMAINGLARVQPANDADDGSPPGSVAD